MIEAFKTIRRDSIARRGNRLTQASVNRELEVLSKIFNKAIDFEKVDRNPCKKVERFTLWKTRGRYFTHAEMRGLGVAVPAPPSPGASRIDSMQDLWTGAGLESVETREITVRRTFADFDDYWATVLGGPSVGPQLAAMASRDLALLKERMRARLPADATGRITYDALANAVKGRVPNQFGGV